MAQDTSRPKIVYYFDALCGWCYGFSPVITKVREKYADRFDFEIVSGGLSLGNNSGPIGEVAPYIKAGAYKDVEKASGVTFGDAFVNGTLEQGTMVLNSVPPGTALAIVKELAPDRAFEYATMLHRGIYVDGMEPEDRTWYGRYAERIGLDAADFDARMEDPTSEGKAFADFQRAHNSGVRGFPTVVLVQDGQSTILTRGFVDLRTFEGILQRYI